MNNNIPYNYFPKIWTEMVNLVAYLSNRVIFIINLFKFINIMF